MNALLVAALAFAAENPPPLAGPPPLSGLPALRRLDPYDAALHESARAGKPLVVFVGQPDRDVTGCVVVRRDGLVGIPRLCVVVRDAAGAVWLLRGKPDDETIRNTIHRAGADRMPGSTAAPLTPAAPPGFSYGPVRVPRGRAAGNC